MQLNQFKWLPKLPPTLLGLGLFTEMERLFHLVNHSHILLKLARSELLLVSKTYFTFLRQKG